MRKTEAIAEAALKKQEASPDLLTNRTGSSHNNVQDVGRVEPSCAIFLNLSKIINFNDSISENVISILCGLPFVTEGCAS